MYNLGMSVYKYYNMQELKKICSSEYAKILEICRENGKYLRLSVIHESQELYHFTCE